MKKKTVDFQKLAEFGSGYAIVDDKSVAIVTEGINGSLKAWLTGGDAMQIGNLVGGKLKRNVDTKSHNGILITQSGRQMLYARYREDEEIITQAENAEITENEKIFKYGNFKWEKITDVKYPCENSAVKYILSNKSVYDNFLKNGYYIYGENENGFALAFYGEEDDSPLSFLGVKPIYHNKYFVICINEKENSLYTI